MKSNPEEFDGLGSWGYTDLNEFKEFLRPDEINLLKDALIEAKRANFTAHVLRKLTGSDLSWGSGFAAKKRAKTVIVPKDMIEESRQILSKAFTESMAQIPVNLEAI
jgi:hypothetical protein